MNSPLHRMGCAALLLTSSLAVVPTHAQPADPLPLDVRLRTVVVQGTLWSEDWGPNPGPNDAPGVRLPVEILPSIVRQCTPLSCPPEPLGASPVTLGPGGFFTMPVVLPEQLLSDTNVVGLQFSVRTNNDQPFTLLSGTLPFAATPFATVAQSVAGPIPAELLTGSMPTGMLRSAFTSPLALTNAGNVLAGDGSRVAHVDAATLGGFAACNLPCYWNLSGNAGTDPDADFIGTTGCAAHQPVRGPWLAAEPCRRGSREQHQPGQPRVRDRGRGRGGPAKRGERGHFWRHWRRAGKPGP
jgi:hypothetical protein